MANLWQISRNKTHSRGSSDRRGQRFYTSTDMAILKHDIAIHNSQLKRGEVKKEGTYLIVECGCGHEGCFLHIEHKN